MTCCEYKLGHISTRIHKKKEQKTGNIHSLEYGCLFENSVIRKKYGGTSNVDVLKLNTRVEYFSRVKSRRNSIK